MNQLDEPPVFFRRDEQAEKLREDVVSSSNDTRRAFFIFGAFSLYLIITVGSTTHLQLLTGTVFSLPVLSVDIPILGFYATMPLLYILAHFNLLGELNALSDDVRRLKDYLREQGISLRKPIPFGPARTLIQPEDSGVPRSLVNVVTLLGIAVLPLLVLLLVQIRFLPYHSEGVTWWHRVIILLDILLVFFLWFPLKVRCTEAVQQETTERRFLWERWLFQGKALSTSLFKAYQHSVEPWICSLFFLMVLLTSFILVTIPDSWLEESEIEAFGWLGFGVKEIGVVPTDADDDYVPDRTYHGVTPAKRKMLTWTYDWFEAPDSWHWMRRNLTVSHTDLVPTRPSDEVLLFMGGDDDELKALWESGSRGLDLRGRDFRYADFSSSELQMADLRGADLEGAVLHYTNLQYANLKDIDAAKLQSCASDDPIHRRPKPRLGAFFCRTNLRYATLQNAEMLHANLWEADLTGANVSWAGLEHTDLQHANLRYSDLKGAKLLEAKLNGADLHHVNFHSTELFEVKKMTWPIRCSALKSGARFKEDPKENESYTLRIEATCKLRLSSAPSRDKFF